MTNQNLHGFESVSIPENRSNNFLESFCSLALSYKGTKIATEFSPVTPRPLGKPYQLICRERHRWKHRQQRPRLIRKKGSISVGQQGLLALQETNITLETRNRCFLFFSNRKYIYQWWLLKFKFHSNSFVSFLSLQEGNCIWNKDISTNS